jgi:ABC-type amino acid transport substrate-binding protein
VRNYLLAIIGVLTLCFNINIVEAFDLKSSSNSGLSESVKTGDDKALKNKTEKPITEKKKYRVGVSYINEFPLFAFADLEDKGFAWSIIESFAKTNNIEFEYVAMPITRLQPSLDSGAIDFIFPDNPFWTAFRSNRLPNIYSGKVISAISATYVRKENRNIELEKVGLVAIPFGYTSYTWIEPIQTYNIKTMPVRDLNTALYSVAHRRADAAEVEYNIGQYLISQNPSLAVLTINPKLPSVNVDYHLSSIKHIVILEKLTTFIEQEQELIRHLHKQYGIQDYHEVYGKELELE